jgi:hypothetical protein
VILIDRQGHALKSGLSPFASAKVWIAECDVCFKQEVAVCRRFSALQKPLAAEGWFFGSRGAIVCASCVQEMRDL